MAQWQLTTPVALFIFNRPDTTARVFETIRHAAPPRLLIVADGPRPHRPEEAGKCAAARAIVAGVDWPCEVSTDFSDVNLGCRRRVSSGLNWVFRSVEEAIILEDDCLPHPSFFRFCEELLERYRDDERVMLISGDNLQPQSEGSGESYRFSRYPHIWGWGSWRRAWQRYDVQISAWPGLRDAGWLERIFPQRRLALFWRQAFEAVYRGEIDTWDHQVTFACLIDQAMCVIPSVNLVSNLGFREDATHTRSNGPNAELAAEEMLFPLHHPSEVMRDLDADSRIETTQFRGETPAVRVRRLIGRMCHAAREGLRW